MYRMANTPTELERFLSDLARNAEPGTRVPSIRDLMRRFKSSQAVVTRAFEALRDRGLISSEVGRGTFFQAGEASAAPRTGKAAPSNRSVLLLRRSISIHRSRVLIHGLQRRFTDAGHRVLEVAYTDSDHAHEVLRGLPAFDACVVQSTFETITIDMLATLRAKTGAIAVDGAALAGLDVDAVGVEWGAPLNAAVALLKQRGHRRIGYATTSHPFLANQLGLKRWAEMGQDEPDLAHRTLAVPALSHENYQEALIGLLKRELDASGRLPFTAIVCWGIEDGQGFRAALAGIGIDTPSMLSVVLLGRADLPNEHANFFETFGCDVEDQIEFLYRAINARWQDPARPYAVDWIPLTHFAGGSVAQLLPAEKPVGREKAA